MALAAHPRRRILRIGQRLVVLRRVLLRRRIRDLLPEDAHPRENNEDDKSVAHSDPRLSISAEPDCGDCMNSIMTYADADAGPPNHRGSDGEEHGVSG